LIFLQILISSYSTVYAAGYFMAPTLSRLHSIEWIDELWIEKDLEGTGLGLTEILPLHLFRGTEENRKTSG
jgi:hypothetical protein